MKLVIPKLIYEEIMFYVDKSPVEISGLGKIVWDAEKRVFTVTAVGICEQENTGTTTDLTASGIGKLIYELRQNEGALAFWWHSHVNMGAFWSGTDEATQKEHSSHTPNGWLISSVFNKKKESKHRFTHNTESFGIFHTDIDCSIGEVEATPEMIAGWESEYASKCKTKTYYPRVWCSKTKEWTEENDIGPKNDVGFKKSTPKFLESFSPDMIEILKDDVEPKRFKAVADLFWLGVSHNVHNDTTDSDEVMECYHRISQKTSPEELEVINDLWFEWDFIEKSLIHEQMSEEDDLRKNYESN